jgi:hypothetical protein
LFFRTLTQILYYTIVLSVAGMSGNPFLNFLLQALIELPGFLIGRAVCDRLGRRWSQAGAFVLTGCFQVACLVILVCEYRLLSNHPCIKQRPIVHAWMRNLILSVQEEHNLRAFRIIILRDIYEYREDELTDK